MHRISKVKNPVFSYILNLITMSELFRRKIKEKKVREPSSQMLVDAIRKVIVTIFIFAFAFFFFYTALNFWDVVISINEFIQEIATSLGFGLIFLI